MAKEIERKYLLMEDGEEHFTDNLKILYPSLESLAEDVRKRGERIIQGYLPIESGLKLAESIGIHLDFTPAEVRLRDRAGVYLFTAKAGKGVERDEEERSVPFSIFQRYWNQTRGKRIGKTRLAMPYHGHAAEIDVYTDRDLIIAEIEVPSIEEAERLLPLGKDVTLIEGYKNRYLAK